MYQLLIKNSKSILLFTKIIVVLLAFYVIYHKIVDQKLMLTSVGILSDSIFKQLLLIFIMAILSSLNWIFEIYKWKILISSLQKISFIEALKQSLSSHTAALITPFKAGEFGVKALFYQKNKLTKVLFLNFLGNASQLLMTSLFGVVGLYYFVKIVSIKLDFRFLFVYKTLFLVFFLILFSSFLVKKYPTKFNNLKSISTSIHLKNVGIALVRYLLFSHQFLLLLFLINPTLDYKITISAIFSMYFLASIIPISSLFDWVLKGSISIFLFGFLGFNATQLVLVTFAMWFFNFAIPAIVGSYFLLTLNQTKIDVNG